MLNGSAVRKSNSAREITPIDSPRNTDFVTEKRIRPAHAVGMSLTPSDIVRRSGGRVMPRTVQRAVDRGELLGKKTARGMRIIEDTDADRWLASLGIQPELARQ